MKPDYAAVIKKTCQYEVCRVYLIEDDAALRFQLAETLRDAGLFVLEYEDAEAFLKVRLDYSPAVIVSDMVLPGLSGIDLIKTVRAMNVKTPLIFISGYSEPSQIIEGMKIGAVDFLWKPFKSDALLKTVAQSLREDILQHDLIINQHNVALRWNTLSEREREVCKCMLRGFGNKDISKQLGIKADTANKHRMKVLKKMEVDNRPQLVDVLKDFKSAHD